MNQLFDAYIMVDWSGKDEPGPQHKKDDRQKKDNIWIGEGSQRDGQWTVTETYCRTRQRARQHLETRLRDLTQAGLRTLVGFDFAFGYPQGFAQLLTGKPGWQGVWEYLAEHLQDDELNENNRFEMAAEMNAKFAEEGPFWGHARDVEWEGLTAKSPWKGVDELAFGEAKLQRLRHTDAETKGVQEVWKLYGAGSVGSQALTGIPVVHALRNHPDLQTNSRIWPFEISMTKKEDHALKPLVVLAEIFPGVVDKQVRGMAKEEANDSAPKDQLQVRAIVQELHQTDQSGGLFHWFFGATSIPEAARMEEAAILRPHPELEGETKKEAPAKESARSGRESSKAEREAERERRKAERDQKKAEREAERERAKAEREAKRKERKANRKAEQEKEAAEQKEQVEKVKEAVENATMPDEPNLPPEVKAEMDKIRNAKPDGINIVEASIIDPSHHSPDLGKMEELRKKEKGKKGKKKKGKNEE